MSHVYVILSYQVESTSIYYCMWTICSIASKSISAIDKMKKDLSFEFEIKDFGEAKKVLGIEIELDQKSGKVSLT